MIVNHTVFSTERTARVSLNFELGSLSQVQLFQNVQLLGTLVESAASEGHIEHLLHFIPSLRVFILKVNILIIDEHF